MHSIAREVHQGSNSYQSNGIIYKLCLNLPYGV